MRRTAVFLLALLAAAGLAAGCSSSGGGGESGDGTGSASGDGGSGESGASSITVGWVFQGTADTDAVSALESAFPDQVTSRIAENAGDDPAGAAQRLVSDGATLVVSEAPGACAQVPDLHCVDAGGGPPGPNAVALDGEFWNRAYLLGRAAGLLTETDIIGYVAAGDSATEKAALNSWTLGCQSANPNCIVRLVVAPANADKAVRRLQKQNADLIATTVADPAICAAAGAGLAVQPVLALDDPCGTAFVVADLATAMQPLVQSELDGSWQGGRAVAVGPGTWSSTVPADAVTKVDERAKEIEDGRNVFTGPLFDNEGNEQVADGEELSPEFVAAEWTWLLGGVLVG